MKHLICFAILAAVYEATIVSGQQVTVSVQPAHAIIKEGESLNLTCTVEGIANPQFTWMRNKEAVKDDKEDKTITITATNDMSHIELKDPTFGNYTCVVMSQNGTQYEKEVTLSEAAKVQPFDKSKNLVQGDRLILECKVRGTPTPSVSWAKDGEEFNREGAELKANNAGIENATLLIPSLEFEDRGDYTCMAQNTINGLEFSANQTVTVRVKDKLAALWPFLGICAEVAILCTIIFIFEKRRAKKMEEEEAKEEAGHLTNSYDNQKADVRQRKS